MTRSHGIDEPQLERKSRRFESVGLRFFGTPRHLGVNPGLHELVGAFWLGLGGGIKRHGCRGVISG